MHFLKVITQIVKPLVCCNQKPNTYTPMDEKYSKLDEEEKSTVVFYRDNIRKMFEYIFPKIRCARFIYDYGHLIPDNHHCSFDGLERLIDQRYPNEEFFHAMNMIQAEKEYFQHVQSHKSLRKQKRRFPYLEALDDVAIQYGTSVTDIVTEFQEYKNWYKNGDEYKSRLEQMVAEKEIRAINNMICNDSLALQQVCYAVACPAVAHDIEYDMRQYFDRLLNVYPSYLALKY